MAHKPIDKRIGIKRDLAPSATIGVGDGNLIAYSWNMDFLAASFYHAANQNDGIIHDGSVWCTKRAHILSASGDTKLMTASNGFTSMSKCTWQVKSENHTVAPSFKLLNASSLDWTFQWVDFINGEDGTLGAGSILGQNSQQPFYLGNYVPSGSNDVFFNPLISTINEANWQHSTLYVEVPN